MPPKRGKSAPRPSDAGSSIAQVEHCIDAVDWLRKHMRGLGVTECADALDEAFAKCLKAYLELQDQTESDVTSTPADRSKPKIN